MNLPAFQPSAASATRFLFFTGKGGVGKTSLSCATALRLAGAGKRVLLVSTDPASNLDEVLETRLTNQPTPVPGVPGLDALNINPVEAAAAYRERLIGPMRGLLPEAALRSMEEQLSGSCTVEIAAFDEFSGLIGNADAARDYDHVIFDTAPTGHTLRLMSLAKAWDQFLDTNTSGTSCLGPLAGLEKQRAIYEATVKTLADAQATTLVLVSRPQLAALREAERTSHELRALGVANQRLVINGVFAGAFARLREPAPPTAEAPHSGECAEDRRHACQSAESSSDLQSRSPHSGECAYDPVAQAMQQRGADAIAKAASFITSLPSFAVPLRAVNILGIAGLRVLLEGEAVDCGSLLPLSGVAALLPGVDSVCEHDALSEESGGSAASGAASRAGLGKAAAGLPQSMPGLESLASLVDDIERQGHGVIMTMGKGGVGKTTVAAAIAVMLARRGHRVHLSTTDPAAHVAQTLDGELDGLTTSRIDPAAETAAYTAEVMGIQGAQMDEAGRALLEEDLRSPCTEEIAVFRAFAREVAQGSDRFVVLDTAPTGHTLLLLDASEAYQREIERQARGTQPESVLRLLERLRDPAFTRILLVTLPEATPVHEAAALQEDLRRARIEPFAWVINQSLLHCGTCDPLLIRREQSEQRYIREVVEKHARRTAWLPWQAEEPVGPDALARLGSTSLELASA